MQTPRNQAPLHMGKLALAKEISDWIAAHHRSILVGAVGIVGLFFFLYRFGTPSVRDGHPPAFQVEKAFRAWTSAESPTDALFAEVEKPLNRHPELSANFSGQIAQRLLTLADSRRAHRYAKGIFNRTKGVASPYHQQFSQTSLLIAEGKYSLALENSLNLKEAMGKDETLWGVDRNPHPASLLYAYNLLRLAALHRQLGSNEAELLVWEEFLENGGWKEAAAQRKTFDPPSYHAVAENFEEGTLSLLDFIEQREKQLRLKVYSAS